MGNGQDHNGHIELDGDFSGSVPVKADSALRVTVPARFKQILDAKCGDGPAVVVLLPAPGKVRVLPWPAWLKEKQQIDSLPAMDPNARKLRNLVYGTKVECQLDAQNRIRLTPELARLAGISKDCVFVGSQHEMEIWDASSWAAFTTSSVGNLDDLYAAVFQGMKG